ncbi:hypothetical protein [Spiroplasma sp. BIUS-1]|uniref:hypothetical protein n=1 Tax=Spiroplasma sp. BIUS-1 TaxID=216964 RepID=UPI001398F4E3|nr:hypothetical protein [Spiroplasma sp. BIUS-1]QHX36546.1 hypothetical protein SBIUS_v1c02930 [Spiroplasma sp. BIUS-1]
MSDKIKVLKINKVKENLIDETTEEFSSGDFWFEKDLDHSISMDFDKTIAIKDKKTSKIDIVQNANSHFFEPNNKDLAIKKEDIENTKFESINIVDKMIKPTNSHIRKEIIEMRKMSYENEQRDKDYLLSKLNVDLKPNNNFKNYNLATKEEEMKQQNKINDTVQEQMNVLNQQQTSLETMITKQEQDLNQYKNDQITKVIKDTIKESFKETLNEKSIKNEIKNSIDDEITKEAENKDFEIKSNFLLADTKLVKNEFKETQETKNELIKTEKNEVTALDEEVKEEEKNIMVEFDNLEHKQNNQEALSKSKISKRTLFDEMDTKELSEFFNDESNKYSVPVFNNNDYTVANTVDDLEKAINNLEFGSKKIREKEKFFDQDGGTTQLVESLQLTSRNAKKASVDPINFDSFETWFNNSRDVKKMAKLAKKENKKMIKISKK